MAEEARVFHEGFCVPAMSPSEMEAFLRRPLIAVLTTIRADGALHSTPVWFEYEEGKFYFWAASGSAKARNIRQNRQASVCIATQQEPYQYVSASGLCEVTTHGLAERCLSICRRYYSEEAARKFVEEDLLYGDSVLIVMTPGVIVSERSA